MDLSQVEGPFLTSSLPTYQNPFWRTAPKQKSVFFHPLHLLSQKHCYVGPWQIWGQKSVPHMLMKCWVSSPSAHETNKMGRVHVVQQKKPQ